jgi:hypothetical protein
MSVARFFFVDELAFVSINTFARGLNVPTLTEFSLVIFRFMCFVIQFMDAVGVSTFMVKLANACLHEVVAQLCLVVQPKVFNIFNHSLSTWEVHLLLWPILCHTYPNIWKHIALGLTKIHQI